jgi:hypothetical protein
VNSDLLDELRRGLYGDKENASTFCPEYKSQQGSHYNLHSSAQEDASTLRSMLNEEMLKNSTLLVQMARIEEENKALRAAGAGGSYGNRDLQSENERLKKALSQASQLPQAIFAEIENLKR